MSLNFNEDLIYEPKELAEFVKKVMAENKDSRAFTRPSGTEDIVRIYAEHPKYEVAKTIADKIKVELENSKVLN